MASPLLTPAVLSKLPLGLLGFFGIKNGGQYPQTLGEVIVPQLELMDLLAVNYREARVFQANVTVVGFLGALDAVTGAAAVVPASEVWYLSAITAGVFTGAGDAVSATLIVRSSQSGSANPMSRALSPLITQAAGITSHHPGNFGEGSRWFYPGDTFGVSVASITSATGTINVAHHVWLTRFPF